MATHYVYRSKYPTYIFATCNALQDLTDISFISSAPSRSAFQTLILLLFSWKQNRGRLASKCSVSSPPSPTRKRKDSSKPTWRQDGFEQGLPFAARHGSSSDIENYMSTSVARNGVDLRDSPNSSSSTASECSEPIDDSPFSPAAEPPKRSRSLSPENLAKVGTMKRRASKLFLTLFILLPPISVCPNLVSRLFHNRAV